MVVWGCLSKKKQFLKYSDQLAWLKQRSASKVTKITSVWTSTGHLNHALHFLKMGNLILTERLAGRFGFLLVSSSWVMNACNLILSVNSTGCLISWKTGVSNYVCEVWVDCETQRCCYLELVNHLIKQFSSFWAVRVLKVIFYTDLNHNGFEVAANTYINGRSVNTHK